MPRTLSCHQDRAPRFLLWPIALAVVCYTVLCLIVFVGILRANNGHLVFSLDDPYIHLALSEQIAHGHYGINATETSSPSSSVIWPFLLAPFARFAWQPFAALVMNFLAGLMAAGMVGWSVKLWPGDDGSVNETARRVLSVVGLVLIGSLVGLTFLGMEHTLQVMLASCCALGMIFSLRGQRIPRWCMVAAVIGPMVRYENLGVTLAIAIALAGQDEWRRAVRLLVTAVVPLVAFSLFLRHVGLPLLPTSVLMKAGIQDAAQGKLSHLEGMLLSALREAAKWDRIVLWTLFATLCCLAWNEKQRVRRWTFAGTAVAAFLHLVIGTFGWFHRYEIYIVLFASMVVLYAAHERPRELLGWYALGMLTCVWVSYNVVKETVPSSHDVYLQEYQMHRFATDYYGGNVAVNDLGEVSYRRRPGEYVLDLFGLGSVESSQRMDKSTQWMAGMVERHNVGLVMIYPGWFSPAPANWAKLGSLCLERQQINLGGSCVAFYVSRASEETQVKQEFEAFVKTLPDGVRVMQP